MYLSPEGIRLASTVLLLRDTVWGMEVYVQERAATMPFYPEMTVFPGGGVDYRDLPGDADGDGRDSPDLKWRGHNTNWWARHLKVEPEAARALVCAAVRETFEEAGTLLAGTSDGEVVADTSPYLADRKRLEDHDLALSDFFDQHELTLRADLLRPWANWVTPEDEEIRYDTQFFVAAQPHGQDTYPDTREAASTGWFRPSTLLDGWRYRKISLMPPTWVQLRLLDTFRSVDEVLGYASDIVVEPVVGAVEERPYMDEYFAVEQSWQ